MFNFNTIRKTESFNQIPKFFVLNIRIISHHYVIRKYSQVVASVRKWSQVFASGRKYSQVFATDYSLLLSVIG